TQLREMLSGLAGLGTLPGEEQKAVEEAADKAEEVQEAVEDVVDQAVETAEGAGDASGEGGGNAHGAHRRLLARERAPGRRHRPDRGRRGAGLRLDLDLRGLRVRLLHPAGLVG